MEGNQSSSVKQALAAIQKAKVKIDQYEKQLFEPIAVVAMESRFPGADTGNAALWELIRDEPDVSCSIPTERWDNSRYYSRRMDEPGTIYVDRGYFLDEIDGFDAGLFDISPREANSLDPQQRLLLELIWQTLESAGIPCLGGESFTGTFFGVMNLDYARYFNRPDQLDLFAASGNSLSALTGRINHLFGFQGPAIAVDTACSSSLVGVHLAMQSLRNHECDLALAGGVNLILHPSSTILECGARMLSPDGRCYTFDQRANGFARGEGCGVVLLKRLSDAEAAGDDILALLRGAAVNHDGQSGGLTVPNGQAQQRVIRQALKSGGVDPSAVSFVEAHGTGTELGDPIEVRALGEVYGRARTPEQPLTIGSIKSLIGHCESAAGIAGLMKVILALKHRTLPGSRHVQTLNPHIPWQQFPIRVPGSEQPWPSAGESRFAAVSSFGFSGTNAHVVVEEAPQQAEAETETSGAGTAYSGGAQLLVMSAKSGAALAQMKERYVEFLKDNAHMALADICYSSQVCRNHFRKRLAIVARDPNDLIRQLDCRSVETPSSLSDSDNSVAVLFDGSDYEKRRQGKALYHASACFRSHWDRCAELLNEKFGLSLVRENESSTSVFYDFALEYALYGWWAHQGLTPHYVVGAGVGEYLAACVAGVYSLDDALGLLAARSRYLAESTDAAFQAFCETARSINYQRPGLGCVTGAGNADNGSWTQAGYWIEHIGVTADPDRIAQTLTSLNLSICLGIGGDGGSIAGVIQKGRELHPSAWWKASLKADGEISTGLLEIVASLYERGYTWNFNHLNEDAGHRKIALPHYPFQRKRYWLAEATDTTETALNPDQLIEKLSTLDDVSPQELARIRELLNRSTAAAPAPYNDLFSVLWETLDLPEAGVLPPNAGHWLWIGELTSCAADAIRANSVPYRHAADLNGIASSVAVDEEFDHVVINLSSADHDLSLQNTAADLVRFIAQIQALHSRVSAKRVTLLVNPLLAPQAAGQDDKIGSGVLRGLIKAANLEWPEIEWNLVTLNVQKDQWVAPFFSIQAAPRRAREFEVTADGVRSPVLYPVVALPAPSAVPVKAVLVTGGLGAIGRQLISWLLKHTAARVVVTGRRALDAIEADELLEAFLANERLHYLPMDVCSRDSVGQVVAKSIELIGGLDAVFHLAGESGVPEPLTAVSEAASRPVLDVKIQGALHLHEALKRWPDCRLIFSSSIASLWGSKYQSAYTIANAVLDDLAYALQRQGRPVCSIQLGPWGQSGLAQNQVFMDYLRMVGVEPLDTELATEAFMRVAFGGEGNTVLCHMDVAKAGYYFSNYLGEGLFSALRESPATGADNAPSFADTLRDIEPDKRQAQVMTTIQRHVADMLTLHDELPDPDLGFNEMGFDSLMVIDLKKQLDVWMEETLDSTALFNYPSIRKLSGFLLEKLDLAPDPKAAQRAVEDLNNQEVEDRLLSILNEL